MFYFDVLFTQNSKSNAKKSKAFFNGFLIGVHLSPTSPLVKFLSFYNLLSALNKRTPKVCGYKVTENIRIIHFLSTNQIAFRVSKCDKYEYPTYSR